MASATDKRWYLQEMERREKELIQKKDNQEPTVLKDKEEKGVGNVKHCILP